MNWKLFMEANLEGYHIKPTHKTTFFPYGYDNLNVVETFGRNSRVTFPFRRIEKLRALPPEQRNLAGTGHVRVSPVPERDPRGAVEPHDDVGARTANDRRKPASTPIA